ncbi:MAG: hypothetical protein LBF19_06495 [Prevotellaceae bacterium]|jgi:hypothetical protein|nr:hypothetical protein [Prevotellaceae bacterium]
MHNNRKYFPLTAESSAATSALRGIPQEPIKEQYDVLLDIQNFIYTTPKVIYTDDVKKIWAYTIINYDITMLVTRSKTSAGYFWEFGVEE